MRTMTKSLYILQAFILLSMLILTIHGSNTTSSPDARPRAKSKHDARPKAKSKHVLLGVPTLEELKESRVLPCEKLAANDAPAASALNSMLVVYSGGIVMKIIQAWLH